MPRTSFGMTPSISRPDQWFGKITGTSPICSRATASVMPSEAGIQGRPGRQRGRWRFGNILGDSRGRVAASERLIGCCESRTSRTARGAERRPAGDGHHGGIRCDRGVAFWWPRLRPRVRLYDKWDSLPPRKHGRGRRGRRRDRCYRASFQSDRHTAAGAPGERATLLLCHLGSREARTLDHARDTVHSESGI